MSLKLKWLRGGSHALHHAGQVVRDEFAQALPGRHPGVPGVERRAFAAARWQLDRALVSPAGVVSLNGKRVGSLDFSFKSFAGGSTGHP